MTAASRPTAPTADSRLVLVAVRLVEGAVLVLLLAAAQELWSSWQHAGVDGFLGRGPVLLDRVWSVVHNQTRGPVAVVVAAVLLAGCLWVAHRLGERRPLSAAGAASARAEVAVLAGLGLLVALADVVVVVVAAAVPYGPELGPSPLAAGEDQLTALLPVAAWPVAGVLLYAALGCLWWLVRRGALDEPPPAGVAIVGGSAEDGSAENADVEEATVVGTVEAQAAEAPAPEERLSSDGSTSNGYDEYFRRS
jgi:hypothetical protein